MAREMKDSGVEWIGQIPSNWTIQKNKVLFKEVNDRCDDGSKYILLSVSEYTGVTPRSAIIKDGEYETHAETLDGYKICHAGDIVMNIMLAWKRATAASSYEGIISPAYCVYRGKGIKTKYFHYLFRSDNCAEMFKRYSTGIIDSRLRLYPDVFLSLKSIVPPLSEQEKIASFLDFECSRIDSVIEQTRASIEEYKKLKQAVITQAVTKGIRLNREMKDSGIEWIGEIPYEWMILRKLSYAVNKNISYGIVKLFEPDDENGVKVLRCSDVREGRIDTANIRTVTQEVSNEYSRTVLEGGEVLINVRGTLGGCAVVPSEMKGYNIAREVAMVSLSNKIINRYLMYFFLSSVFMTYEERHLAGSVYIGLNIEMLSACPIPLPPLIEQRQISDYLDKKIEVINQLIEKKEELLSELENYKKIIIFEYVTGKKEVPA